MGLQDRDYWRDWKREQESGGGRVDPTHWREDELTKSDPPRRRSSGDGYLNSDSESLLRFWSWVIGFAVLVAVLTLGFRAWQQHLLLKQLEAVAQQAAAEMHKQQEIARRIAAQQSLRDEERRQAELEKVRAFREARESRDRAAMAEAQFQAQKASAWKRYYKPSAACERDSGTVACANEHIRAKRAFDAQFKG